MPYKTSGNKVYVKKGGKWKVKAIAKSVDSAKKMANLLRGVKHGWKPTKAKEFNRVVDRKMKDYGEIDFTKKKIRVNPRRLGKGGIVDTVIHEELHNLFPNMGERRIRKLAQESTKTMEMDNIGDLLKRYKEKKKKSHYRM